MGVVNCSTDWLQQNVHLWEPPYPAQCTGPVDPDTPASLSLLSDNFLGCIPHDNALVGISTTRALYQGR